LATLSATFGHMLLRMRRNGYLCASGQNSDNNIQFGDPSFLKRRIFYWLRYIFLCFDHFFSLLMRKKRYFYLRQKTDTTVVLRVVAFMTLTFDILTLDSDRLISHVGHTRSHIQPIPIAWRP